MTTRRKPSPEAPDDAVADLLACAKELAAALDGPLRRVTVRSGSAAVLVEWQPAAGPQAAGPPATEPPATAPSAPAAPVLVRAAGAPPADSADGGTVIASPMVGTFYRSPDPGSPPFVEPGDMVEAGQTVGIVEAMKLYNEIVAETAGVVAEVLVENGGAVEFDQPLLRLKTAAADGEG